MDYPSTEKKISYSGTSDLQLPVPCDLLPQISAQGTGPAGRPGGKGSVPRDSRYLWLFHPRHGSHAGPCAPDH